MVVTASGARRTGAGASTPNNRVDFHLAPGPPGASPDSENWMTPFDFQATTRLVHGAGRIVELGSLARSLGAARALLVSDAGVVRAGHAARGLASLEAAGLATALFDAVHENPTTRDVEATLAVARAFQPDLLVGLGGGSSMDCAKGANFLYCCGGAMRDYWGQGKATGPLLPMIAVPTTAGTGSETQSYALISDAETHVKMACGDKRAACRVALLDPELTATQPSRVTALTGVDALAHALETLVTRPRNPLSLAFSREALWLIAPHLGRVLANPQDIEARAAMQVGAAWAGLAIENSMLGAAHALANPLTARFGVPHGEAVGLMLAHVIRFNTPVCEAAYGEAAGLVGLACGLPGPVDLADWTAEIVRAAGLATSLAERGVQPSDFAALATSANSQWTAGFNPRPVAIDDLSRLYEAAYDGCWR